VYQADIVPINQPTIYFPQLKQNIANNIASFPTAYSLPYVFKLRTFSDLEVCYKNKL